MSLLTSLISYWSLDEASGDALDAHGSNDLTDNNTVGSGTGKVGNARDFESSVNEFFSHTDNSDLSCNGTDFTFAAWINLESVIDGAAVLGKYLNTGNQREYTLVTENAGSGVRLQWYVSADGAATTRVEASSFGALSTGTWLFVVVDYNDTTNEISIQVNNGTKDTASHAAGSVFNSTADFNIGAIFNGTVYFWDGLIDEVGFWKKVLTADEREDLYNDGHGLAYSDFSLPDDPGAQLLEDMVSWWALDESSGDALDSHSSNTLTDHASVGSAAGKVSGARDFESGSSQYFSCSSNASLQTGDIDFSVSGWVKLETWDGNDRAIIARRSIAGTLEYSLSLSNFRFRFVVSSDGSNATEANWGSDPDNTSWWYITAWHDSINNQIAISVNDGTPVNTSHSTGVFVGSVDLTMGMLGNGSSWPFDGLIDEVAFWKRRLTPWERRWLYNSGSGRAYSELIAGGGDDLTTSLISYWPLGESAGSNALDSTATGNTLTDVNTVGSAVGKIGNARDFESDSTQYFTRADNASLSTGDISFTLAAWVNLESEASYPGIIGKWNNLTPMDEYLLYYRSDNHRFAFDVSDDGTATGGHLGEVVANNFGTPSLSTWYYVIVWHDADENTINIQVSNSIPNSVAWSTGVFNGTADFRIGIYNGTNQPFDGLIDEVAFWKRVLTTQERAWLYNSGNGRAYEDFAQETAVEKAVRAITLHPGFNRILMTNDGLLAVAL